jgi:hypothetical protein
LLDAEALKELLARSDVSNKDKVVLSLAANPLAPRSTTEVRDIAVSNGLREAKGWNLYRYLTSLKPLIIKSSLGWELTDAGRRHVSDLAGTVLPSVTPLVISSLRKQLPAIHSQACRSFAEESIAAFEAKLYRSAIVLSWVGAVALLYDHVIASHLAAFNAEALKRDAKWRTAKNADDLARMKEFDFLQVLAAISIIGKNVKDELEVCLRLRNGCGHPNSLVVGEHKASAHVETLMQNVYQKF